MSPLKSFGCGRSSDPLSRVRARHQSQAGLFQGVALMRVYRKTTTHPFCIYLTAEEARELETEALIASVHSDDVPLLEDIRRRLDALWGDPTRKQA